ncbi:MFS transporter, partial [Candidatus Sumerlaeota bacterium]|nr:MFS transporter [Candidatus Sumerlaeota bacterium]
MTDRDYRKIINSWAMYDWANSGFYTSAVVVLFPYFHRAMAENSGLSKQEATACLGYTIALGLLLSAVIAPVMGAIADHTGGRKRYLAFFLAIGVLASACLSLLGPTAYLLGSALYVLAYVGFSGAEVFYESLLPHIALRNDIDQISARGYAIGYLGGGILLAINALWLAQPGWFLMPDRDFAVRASFLSVAVWWVVFSLPLLRNVPEPPRAPSVSRLRNPVRVGFERLGQTLRRVSRYRQLVLFLAAFWLYSDGIGTIIKMSFSYGEEVGIAEEHLLLAILM